MNRRRAAIAALFMAAWTVAPAAVQAAAAEQGVLAEKKLVLRAVAPDGISLSGAKVGTGLNVFEDSQGHPPQTIVMWLRGQQRSWPFVSDAQGQITLTGEDADHRNFYALYESRGWAGYKQVLEGSTGSRVDIRLEPACRVHGQLTSRGFDRLGYPLSKTVAFLYDSRERLLMYFVSERGRYEFLLPSGRYELECVGEGPAGIETQRVRWELRIETDQRELDGGVIDLAPTKLAELYGQAAPPLKEIVEWRGQPPLELLSLRGNVVVLVFWGSWSRPCLQTMPQLMELHDMYAEQGVVIIGVHDNSVATVAELDAKLVEAHQLYWGRRDLPFPVGLDRGPNWGGLHDAYGVDQWPTTVVIDPNGNVAGKFSPWGALQAELPRLLGQQ
ncbi:MAG: TlpA disulfide reductase family protein [Sedimentisphaerales bacterium]|nr:TlpA disulfide reductase family protein [Sedimentisphaerales bacterium]NLZ04696.1 TlpA family protein disulfide reductase [Phycisphaerae bacterium]HNY80232.1 TlpA disulfide reductase family protein [Sedimentisphaerales bacterium]HOC63762.1 TlpA disulfide reductase family protein [Sedimentisphaerales bacterium]HOH65916.1 TlpA disulfide reductase family protein [Sedimentisphaerales bacterium]